MATFAELIADPYSKRQIIANVTAYTGSTTTTLRYSESGFTSLPTDSVPNELWEPRIVEVPMMRRSMFSPSAIGGRADSDYGTLVLANASSSADTLDALRTYAFDGRLIELRMVGELSTGGVCGYADSGVVFYGTAAGDAIITEETVTLRLRGYEWLFDNPSQVNVYRGMSHCLAYDGLNDDASFNTHTSIDTVTFEAWMRCDGDNTAVDAQVVAEHGTGHAAATLDWSIQVTTAGVLQAIVYRTNASPLTLSMSGVDVRDGFFHHVALSVQTGTNLTSLMWDGAVVASGTAPTFAAVVAAYLQTGTRLGGGSNYFNGRLDEIRFWTSARTAAQIQANMNAELANPVAAEMFGYWKLNDNLGSAPVDSSGNAKTGSITGASWASSFSGDASLAGKLKPIVYGAVSDAEPVLIDATRLVYQVHDGSGGQPLNAVRAVYDNGVALTVTTQYTVDLTRGHVTLLQAPAGRITVDCDGESTFQAAVHLDGSNDYINATPTCPGGDVTIEFLAKPDASISSSQIIAGFRNGSDAAGTRRIGIGSSGTDVPRFLVANDAGTTFSVDAGLVSARWCRFSAVLDTSASQILLYLDGELAGSTAVTGTFATVLSNLDIGRLGGSASNFFAGSVDDVRIWNTARTQAEIQATAATELTGTETGLEQYWKFNERTGTSAANAVAGGSVATLTNGPTWVASRQSGWDLARRCAAHKASIASFDEASFTAANGLSSASCGMFIRDNGETIGDAIDYMLSGHGAFHYFSRTGSYTVGQFTAPSSGGTAFTTLEILDTNPMQQEALEPPVYRVRIGWRRNWTPQDEGSIAGALSTPSLSDRRAFVTNEWRYAVTPDSTIRTTYSAAEILSIDSSLYDKSDAYAEAVRQLALHGVHREMWSVPLFAQPYSLDIGQSISLTRPRFGLDSGRDFVVVGFTETPDGIDTEVWG